MTNDQISTNYLTDLGVLLKEYSLKAKHDFEEAKGKEDREFKSGYLMGLYRVVSLMDQQAEAFQMERKQIGFEGFEPEELLK